MKFKEFEGEARRLTESALLKLGLPNPGFDFEVPADPSYGDLSTTVSMKLGKSLRKQPFEVAKLIASAAPLEKSHYVESVSPHQSGYLNFVLRAGLFCHEAIQEVLSLQVLGGSNVEGGKRVVVEHTNVNPNKALHIGHARNLVMGDSLSRIMKRIGHRVQVLNYIDDSGAQVADIIVGFKFLGMSDEVPPTTKFDAYCGDTVYVKVNRQYEADPSLREKQSFVLQAVESGTGEISNYAKKIVARILADQLKTCWRLGARYDLINWESQIVRSGMWSRVFEDLKRKGLAVYKQDGDNKGCWVMIEKDTGEEKVLVRSDGTAVYVAKDIPYAAWKLGIIDDPFSYFPYVRQSDGSELLSTAVEQEMNAVSGAKFGAADLAVTVIDARQSNLQRIVSQILDELSRGSKDRYLHRGYEVVALSNRTAIQLGIQAGGNVVHMQGRKGIYVNVDTMLDALKKKAVEETRKRNPERPVEWVETVAEEIAVAALRFELVKQDPDKMIIFDLEDSMRLEGETGPYLQYTYARAKRILEKAGEAPAIDTVGASQLTHPLERELVKVVSRFDIVVERAGEFLSPKEVARYAFRISSLFNEYYEKVQVIRESQSSLRLARLALVEAFSRVLHDSLELVGIAAPERI